MVKKEEIKCKFFHIYIYKVTHVKNICEIYIETLSRRESRFEYIKPSTNAGVLLNSAATHFLSPQWF